MPHAHTHTKYSTYLLFVVKGNIFIILGTLCAVQNVKYAHVAVLVVTIMFLLSVLHTHALLHILHFMLTAENILFITYSSLFIYSIFLSFFFSCAVFNCHVKLLASSIFPGQYVSNLISKRVTSTVSARTVEPRFLPRYHVFKMRRGSLTFLWVSSGRTLA